MASTAAWLANPFWTASAEAGRWAGNKIGGPVKSGVNRLWNIPGDIWGGIKGTIGGQNSFTPGWRPIDQTASERERLASLTPYNYQQGLLGRFDETMSGGGPSVAQLQMMQGTAEALRNAGSQAANARGVSRALAQRSAGIGGMLAQQQANRDAALMRAQEQLSARQQAAGVAEQMQQADLQRRQQAIDIEKADQQAFGASQGQRVVMSEGNANRAQKGAGAVLSGIGGAIKGMFSDIRAKEDVQPVNFAQRLRSMDQGIIPESASNADVARSYQNSSDAGYAAMQAQLQASQAQQIQPQQESQGLPGIGGAIGGGLESFGNGLMSDERSKEKIRELETKLAIERGQIKPRELDWLRPSTLGAGVISPSERRLTDLPAAPPEGLRAEADTIARESKRNLSEVNPYVYRYRPEFAEAMGEQARQVAIADARSPRMGVMTQELKQTPGGREIVMDTPAGQMIDQKRALSFMLANQAGLNQRLADIERHVSRRM